MKRWLAMGLSLTLIGFYFLDKNLTYAENGMELLIKNLKREIKQEEAIIEALRNKYAYILRQKQETQGIIEREKQRNQQIKNKKQEIPKKELIQESFAKIRELQMEEYLDKLTQAYTRN